MVINILSTYCIVKQKKKKTILVGRNVEPVYDSVERVACLQEIYHSLARLVELFEPRVHSESSFLDEKRCEPTTNSTLKFSPWHCAFVERESRISAY